MNRSCYGVDVSMETLEVALDGKTSQIENNVSAIKAWLKTVPQGSIVGMEATNTYHLLAADQCHAAGMKVYVVNPRITRHYREVMNLRGHNDRMDAKALATYIRKEHDGLREYVPKSKDQRRLHTLIRRRNKLVGIKGQLCQSMLEVKEIKKEVQAVVKRIDELVVKMEALIDRQLEGNEDRKRLETIKGVGSVVSAALVCALEAGGFQKADSFVAFCGLDTKDNQSGKFKGRKRLSKQGDRLLRTLLYAGAMSGARTKVWRPIYEKCLERGLTKIQSLVVLARKIARTAWSIYTYKTKFDPARINGIA